MRSATLLFAFVFALLLTAGAALAPAAHAQIYVDRDASGTGDGSSWANAYTDLQMAIDNATGSDQIWIAEGTYKPTHVRPGEVYNSPTDDLSFRKKSFVIPSEKDGLKLYGGFDGTESALAQRDPAAHEVILSGDVNSFARNTDDSIDPDVDSDNQSDTRSTTDHLRGSFRSDVVKRGFRANAYHVVWMESGLSRSTVLDGVTITGGMAVEQLIDDFSTSPFTVIGGAQREYGGGLFCDGCSATIRGVTFQGNYAHRRGGGAYVASGGSPSDGNPLFVNTVFWGNNAGERPPTGNADSGPYQPFEWIFDFGGNLSTASYDSFNGSSGSGGALYDAGSAEVVNATAYQNTPDAFNGASVENSVTTASGLGGFDLDPNSPSFLQITSETANAIGRGDAALLPNDVDDVDGNGNTTEPLPLDARGAARIQGGALDRGAFESPFETSNPLASPGALPVGASLTITGLGVDDATAVRIGGTPATNLAGTGDSNERITVTVASGTSSGLVEVDTPGGTLTAEDPVAIIDAPYGPGQALGSPGTVTLSNESAFDFTEGFTVSVWVKGGFAVDKDFTQSGSGRLVTGWRLSGTPGGTATFKVRMSALDPNPNRDRQTKTLFPSISLPNDGQWHHVAGVFNVTKGLDDLERATATVYVDGVPNSAALNFSENDEARVETNDVPVTLDASGVMDQVRIYDRPLAESDLLTDNTTNEAAKLDVRRRIHATADLSDPQFDGLLSAYRFDTGNPTTAFDYAGPNSGTYQNGAGPVLSTAPIGQDAGSIPIGPDGASFVSRYSDNFGTDLDAALIGLYRYGAPDGTMRTSSDPGEAFDATLPGGLTERAALTWGGYKERTMISATTGNITQRNPGLTVLNDRATVVEYANVTSVAEPVGLLYRVGPGQPWRTADATKDPAAQTFRVELPEAANNPGGKATPPGEYAVASFPFSDLRLTLTPETQALAPGETATFTATLTNDGPDDVPGVTVDFDATALSGLAASGGTFTGTTWDIGTLAGGTSATLTLTATSEAGPSALRAELGLNDINNGNNAAQAVVPASPAYGPGQALAFDGTDDHLRLRPDVRLDNRSFTISFWAKRASTGSEQIILSQGTGSGPGEALRIGFRSDDRFTVDVTGASVTTDTPITDTDWHHWAIVHDAHPVATDEGLAVVIYLDGQMVKEGVVPDFYRGGGDLLIGRSAQSGGQHFAGALDQLRIWNQEELSASDIRARMHQRLAPGDVKAANLLASYRFDEGSGSFAHSAGQGPLATFEGDPQWVPFSAARLGEKSAVATSSSDAGIGPTGARLSATGVSGGDVQLYRYGRATAPLRTEGDPGETLSGLPTGITERSHQTWGVSVPGGTSPSATLTLDYSSAVGTATTPAAPVRLIRRDAPGEPWQVASGWTKDKAAQTFTSTGTVPTGEYALVTLPYADLAVSIDPPAPVASGEDAAFTVTLTNTGPDASVAAAVDLSSNAELGTLTPGTPSAGSVSGTTWTVGALASGQGATLEVTAPFAGPEPGTLTATATDAESVDPQAGNDSGTATVITPPYGAETALSLDGTDDELNAGASLRLDNRSFSIDFWAKRAATGVLHYVIGQGTAQSTNQSLHVGFEDDDQFAFAFYGNDLKAPAFASTDWHHWTVTYDHGTGARTIYRDGTAVASDNIDPTTAAYAGTGDLRIGRVGFENARHFNGDLDQVRVWNRALSEAEVRARMHRTIAPTDAAFSDLIASYRFDVGTGTTAYDYAGSAPAAFQGDPQWTAFSGANVGQTSAVAMSSTDASIGPDGAQLSATNTSGDVQLYRYGDASAPLRTESDAGENLSSLPTNITERSHLTWGVAVPGGTSPSATLTLDYSSAVGTATTPAAPVRLIRRDAPGQPWQVASGWTKDKAAQTFTSTGTVQTGEYALVTLPYADLAVSIDPPPPVDSGEDAAFSVTLTNTGPNASVSAAVDLSTNATLGTLTAGSVPTGSFDGTTWTVGALASGQGATLEVTAPFAGPEPGTLTATATDAESVDPQASNDAGTSTVITSPYGPETALDLESGDWLRADPVSSALADASALTMETWVRLDDAGSGYDSFLAFHTGTGGNLNWLGYDHDQDKFLYYDEETGNEYAANTSSTGIWHHVVATIDASDSGVLYVNGTQEATFTTSTRPQDGGRFSIGQEWDDNTPSDFFDGKLDQVRLWNRSLSEAEIRTRMHRTIAPTDAAFGDLIASYRFDAGSGTTAYDYAGASTASFQGDPQWTAFSAVPVGQQSARATPGTDALVGPTGARLLVSGVSADAVQLYRYGQSDGPVRDGSAPGDRVTGLRSNLTWGLATPGTAAPTAAPTADLTIAYSSVAGLGLSDASVDPVLLVRPGPGTPWQTASGWTHDAANQTFTFSGPVSPGEYALGRAAILYVDGTAGDDANPGTSWSQPFATLTKALATASSEDEIWIAEGTYTPTSGTDRTASFTVTGEQDGLRIYGGFENGDTIRSDRNPADHPVVLSGDIDGDDALSGNSYHVLVVDGGDALGATVDANVTPATVLSGVLITGGNAEGSAPNDDGGGLYCDGQGPGNTCSPTLTGVVFSGNSADDAGGAIVNRGREGASRPRITNAIFTGNSAASGGAMFNDGSEGGASSALMTNVTFAENAAIEGGAIYNFGSTGTSAPALTNTILWGNSASSDGSQVFNTDAAPTFAHSLIQGSGGSASWDASLGTDAGGNLDADPLFADADAPAGSDGVFGTADDGLRLAGGSPAIARGTYAPFEAGGLAETVSTDLAGGARRFGLFPDLGAYELSTIAATSDQIADAGGLLGYVEPSGFEGRLLLRENTAGSGFLTFTRTDDAPDDLSGELPSNVAPVTWTITSALTPAPTYDLMLEVSRLPGIGDFSALMLYKSADDGQTWDAVTDLGGTLVRDEGRALVAVQDLEGFSQFAIASTDPSNPLPVELARFEAQRAGEEAITVQWQTLSETNNAGFEVQRRAAPNVEASHRGVSTTGAPAGAPWTTIARLEGAGTTDTPQSYRFEDTDLPYAADSLSYRLRQVDTDGTESFSGAVTIARPVPGAELLPTYPNPARGQATVRFAVPERQDVRIVLYDLLGRRVQTVVDAEAEGRTEQVLDVSRMASGTYFLRMQTDGHTETQRLTVVR